MANFEYTITLLIIFIIGIAIHTHYKMDLFKGSQWVILFILFIIIGYVWEIIAVNRGFWIYPAEKNIGIILFNLPIEELLFYIIVPYFVIVLYRATRQNNKTGKKQRGK